MPLAVFLIIAGAILRFAVNANAVDQVNLHTVGDIFLWVGFGLLLLFLLLLATARSAIKNTWRDF